MRLVFAIQYIFSVFSSKRSYMAVSFLSSFSLTMIIEEIYTHIKQQHSIISLSALFVLVMLTGFFIIVDLITGVVASRYENEKIKSSKWGITIGKLFGLTLYFVLCAIILMLLSNNYFVSIMIYGPVILTLLKEYISIGENIERRFGKKAYIFTIIDKVFDILETRFFKTLKEKEIKNSIKQETKH